jgi:hypothetical protein
MVSPSGHWSLVFVIGLFCSCSTEAELVFTKNLSNDGGAVDGSHYASSDARVLIDANRFIPNYPRDGGTVANNMPWNPAWDPVFSAILEELCKYNHTTLSGYLKMLQKEFGVFCTFPAFLADNNPFSWLSPEVDGGGACGPNDQGTWYRINTTDPPIGVYCESACNNLIETRISNLSKQCPDGSALRANLK